MCDNRSFQRPMEKMRQVAPHLLGGETGWQMRDSFTEVLKDITDFETQQIEAWKASMPEDLLESLKQPLLVRTQIFVEWQKIWFLIIDLRMFLPSSGKSIKLGKTQNRSVFY